VGWQFSIFNSPVRDDPAMNKAVSAHDINIDPG
jgi:hypothetical protein